jgi:dienelactone hydrolase
MSEGGVIQRVPVAPSPIVGKFTFPANRTAPAVPIPVMVRHPHTAPARVEVVVGVSRRLSGAASDPGGSLEASGDLAAIHWFDRTTAGSAITIPANGLPLTKGQLNAGFHMFAESDTPTGSVGGYVLTLVVPPAGAAPPPTTPPPPPFSTVGLTAVRLTIDVFPPGPAFGPGVPTPMPEPTSATAPAPGTATDKWFLGRTVNVQDAGLAQARARIRVRQVEPTDFTGNLSISQRALAGTALGRSSARAALLDDDNTPPLPGLPPPSNVVLPNPLAFAPPGILGRDFFVEGRALSSARRDVAFQLGLDGGEPDGDRVAFTIGVGCSIEIGNTLRAVLVKKPGANPARQPVTLRTNVAFTRQGSFDVSGNTGAIRWFATASSTPQLALPLSVPGAQLSAAAGFQLFAEGFAASGTIDDVVLSLTLADGAPPAGTQASAKMTAVALTLDICAPRVTPRADPVPLPAAVRSRPGRTVQVREADFSHQRAMLIVHRPSPALPTDLVIEAVGQGGPSRLAMFFDEDPVAGQLPVISPRVLSFVLLDPPGLKVFVEGTSVSTGVRDTSIRLGIPGLDPEGDRVDTTVYGDLSQPGPFPVGEKDYARVATFNVPAQTETFSALTVAEFSLASPTRFNAAFDVVIRGLIRYPATAPGVDADVSTLLDTYPLVILAHGNHRVFSAPGVRVNNFNGLEDLARHLASYGYVAASVDLDGMNLPARRDPAIVQRGLTILENITELETLNGTDPQLRGRIDLGRMALVGHSRGGEGVVSAEVSNRAPGGPGRPVQAVVSIAPTDALGLVNSSTPYLVIYGTADNDVKSGQPFQLYDRATRLKSMVFIEGAIHNLFSTNTDWVLNPDSGDGRAIGAAEHLNLARAYALGWIEMAIRGQRDHLPLFDRNGRPASVPGPAIFHQFQQVAAQRAVVDNFEQGAFDLAAPLGPQLATRAERNTLNGPVTVAGLVAPVGLANARTEASLRRRELAFFCHDTFGAMVAWAAAGGTYTTAFAASNVSGFRVLSFRAAQRFGVARNPNPAGLAPGVVHDLTVRVTDSAARAARVRAGTVATIPFPWKRPTGLVPPAGTGEGGETLNKSALRTIRLPLAAFKDANGALDLTAVVSITFEFDQRATGELAIDDIEFSD